jgi:hypothetical protein
LFSFCCCCFFFLLLLLLLLLLCCITELLQCKSVPSSAQVSKRPSLPAKIFLTSKF